MMMMTIMDKRRTTMVTDKTMSNAVYAAMALVLTLVGLAAYADHVADAELGPATYRCSWHPEVLTLEGFRGKISIRRYTFSDKNGMPYIANNGEYRECVALPRTATPQAAAAEEEATRWAHATVFAFLGMLLLMYMEASMEKVKERSRVALAARDRRKEARRKALEARRKALKR